jgi:thymidylate synthase
VLTFFNYKSANDLFINALDIANCGDIVSPRGKRVTERRGVTLVLNDVERNVISFPQRKLNYHFMVAEWLWMLHGLKDVKTIAGYNKQIAQFSDNGETFFGAYGPRVQRDLVNVEQLLRKDPSTRQAVMCTWRHEALYMPTKDVPCTLTWQFFNRNDKLELHVNMRSNDVWLGLPYDIYNFTQIQRHLAQRLDIGVGAYYHHVGSLHLYDDNREAAEQLLNVMGDPTDDEVNDVGASPPPSWLLDDRLVSLLEGLPRGIDIATARSFVRGMSTSWHSFAGVLLHRYSKDRSDLDTFWQRLIP